MATSKANRQFKQVECFNVVKHEGKFIITIGNQKATEKTFDTIKQAEQYIATKPYELIANMCYAILVTTMNIKQNESQQHETERNNQETNS